MSSDVHSAGTAQKAAYPQHLSSAAKAAFFDASRVDHSKIGRPAEFHEAVDNNVDGTGHTVYNFEVEKYHTYIAGGIRVHNSSTQVSSTFFGLADLGTTSVSYNGDVATVAGGYGYQLEALNKPAVYNGVKFVHGNNHGFAGIGALEPVGPGIGRDDDFGYHYTADAIGRALGLGKYEFEVDKAKPSQLGDWTIVDGVLVFNKPRKDAGVDNADNGVSQPSTPIDGFESFPGDRDDNGAGGQGADFGGNGPADDFGSDPGDFRPILLDLDGTGVEVIELSQSTVFMDATGDGLQNRTAWAASGNGVLFYDADDTGQITEKRQYVFTEWDPTATSDIEALRSVFDTNGDGVLSGAELDDFKVMVTNDNGSLEAKSLSHADIDITSIDLTADATHLELPDGSVITGQTTFTRSDGTTGTVADTSLVADSQGYRLEQNVNIDGTGTRTEVSTGYAADGAIAFVITSVTTSDGASITNSYDDDGDGVVDRVQTIVTTAAGTDTLETVTNWRGADVATAVLVNRQVTTTNADGSVVTIDRDSLGGGWFDQTEVRTTHADGSRTIVVSEKGQDGTVYMSVTETVSIDGLVRDEAVDRDGDGVTDTLTSHVIVVNGDGSRSETVTVKNTDGSVRSSVTETVSADGRTKTIDRDLDGDGQVDTTEDLTITVNGDGSTSSDLVVKNGDGSTRSSVAHTQSDDALSKTAANDVDGDGDVDVTRDEVVTIATDGSRESVVTETNTDGSVRSMEKITLGADKVTSETWADLGQDGVFDASDLVRSVTVDAGTGDRTETVFARNADGSVNATSVSVTSADGLSSTTTMDDDGDGVVDVTTSSVTVVNGDGSTTETVAAANQDGSARMGSVVVTSADGLTVTTSTDVDGDGSDEEVVVAARVANPDGSATVTTSTYAGDGTTLLSRVIVDESADRRVMTTTVDANGDGAVDEVTVVTQAVDGASDSVTTVYAPDGTVVSEMTAATSADGLTSSGTEDIDGDTVIDVFTSRQTVLQTDGSRVTTATVTNSDLTLRSQTVETVRDDGLQVTVETDADGDGAFERTSVATTVLNADGSQTTVTEEQAEDGSLISRTRVVVSDDGLVTTSEADADGDGVYDLVTTATTVLQADGGTSVTTEMRDDGGVLRDRTVVTSNDNGRDVTEATDVNGDGVDDMVTTTVIADDGVATVTVSELDALGGLQSRSQVETSANGLMTWTRTDADGDETYEFVTADETVLNSDGSVTTTSSLFSDDGSVHAIGDVTVSDDGLQTTSTYDLDNSGSVEFTTIATTVLAADGSQTSTTETYGGGYDGAGPGIDGPLINRSVVTTSSDRRTNTESFDADGDGNDDHVSTLTLGDGGVTTEEMQYFASDTTLLAKTIRTESADGLQTTWTTDRNGDGVSELSTSDATSIAADGATTRLIAHRQGVSDTSAGTLLARESIVTSDDAMTVTWSTDLDGDSSDDLTTTSLTTYEVDGDTVLLQTTSDGSGGLMASREVTTSGNGLKVATEFDFDANSYVDSSYTSTSFAGGGREDVLIRYAADGVTETRREQTEVSSDGWYSVERVDTDGDGYWNRSFEEIIDLSLNLQSNWRDVIPTEPFNGVHLVTKKVSTSVSANGLSTHQTIYLNDNSQAHLHRATTTTFDAMGNAVTVFEESFGADLTTATLAEREETVSQADGLGSITSFDRDGDGTIDGVTTVTETITNGERRVVTETQGSDGALHRRQEVLTTADGRTQTISSDVDGDGTNDSTVETVVGSDGRVTVTTTAIGADDGADSTTVTETTGDGLIRTVTHDGITETTTYSPIGNGTYQWDNGVQNTEDDGHITVSHIVDGAGIETWTLTRDVVGEISTHTVVLDAIGKDRLLAEAARIYDTILDRDMQSGEIEGLVEHTVDGQLDQLALIAHVVGSEEFANRFGELSDAEFVTRIYRNAFERAPSLGNSTRICKCSAIARSRGRAWHWRSRKASSIWPSATAISSATITTCAIVLPSSNEFWTKVTPRPLSNVSSM